MSEADRMLGSLDTVTTLIGNLLIWSSRVGRGHQISSRWTRQGRIVPGSFCSQSTVISWWDLSCWSLILSCLAVLAGGARRWNSFWSGLFGFPFWWWLVNQHDFPWLFSSDGGAVVNNSRPLFFSILCLVVHWIASILVIDVIFVNGCFLFSDWISFDLESQATCEAVNLGFRLQLPTSVFWLFLLVEFFWICTCNYSYCIYFGEFFLYALLYSNCCCMEFLESSAIATSRLSSCPTSILVLLLFYMQ